MLEVEELEQMLADARRAGDVRLRRQIKHHQPLKYVAEILLQREEERGGADPENQVMKPIRVTDYYYFAFLAWAEAAELGTLG